MLHIFGDSITKSIAFDEVNGFRTVEDNFIRRAASACGLALNNRSLFGATITKGKQLLRRFAKDLREGDAVLLAYGGNDCNFPWNEISEAPEKEHTPKTPKEHFALLLTQSVQELRERGLRPLLMTLPPLQPRRFFRLISQGLSEVTLLRWLGSVDAIYDWQESYSHIVEEVSRKLQVPLFDARGVLLSSPHYEQYLCSDGMHINEAGQEALTGAFAKFLDQAI